VIYDCLNVRRYLTPVSLRSGGLTLRGSAHLRCWRCSVLHPQRKPTLIGAAWVTVTAGEVKVQPYGRLGKGAGSGGLAGAPLDELLGRQQPTGPPGDPLRCSSCHLGPFYPPLERLRKALAAGYEEILVGASGQVSGMGTPLAS
jgi:hypothetical protein